MIWHQGKYGYWYKWFAWHPVVFWENNHNVWVWLRYVWRKDSAEDEILDVPVRYSTAKHQ